MPTRRLSVPLACVLCGLAAVLWHCRALSVPFLSDDYLMVRYLDRASGAVHWDVVLAEFWSPWFGVRDMYRPLVSLSYGVELQLWGADSVLSHAVNVALLAGATAAIAFVGSQFGKHRPSAAALVAGAVMVLHPADVEVTSWVAARTAGLEALFSTLAMAMLCLRAAGRLRPWPVWLCTALALLSKEGALVLPAVLLGLDVVLRGRMALRDLRLHLPLWLLLGALLLWRFLILGIVTSGAPIGVLALGGNLVSQMHAAVLPPHAPRLTVWLACAGGAIVLLAALRTLRWRGALLLALFAIVLMPVSRVPAADVAWAGRLALPAVPVLATLVTTAVNGAAGRWRAIGAAGAAGLLLAWGILSLHWQQYYQRGAATVEELAHSLQAEAGSDESPPLGLLRVDPGDVPILLLHPKAWYLLARRPFAKVERPVTGLACLLQRDEVSEDLFLDLSPARALLDASGSIAEWDAGVLQQWRRSGESLPELSQSLDHAGSFVAPAPLPVFDVAAVHAVAEQAVRGPWSLRLHAREGQLQGLLLPVAGVPDPDGRGAWFDLQRALAPVLLAHSRGTLVGFDVEAPPGASVRLLPYARPRLLPLPAPLDGADVPLGELGPRLQRNAGDEVLQAVILAPATALSVVLRPGEAVQLTPRALGDLGYVAGVAGPMPCWWYVQTMRSAAGQPGRSRLDRFRLRLDGQ